MIRPWKLTDATALAQAINNEKIQANLRDGIPFPYTVKDAEEYIRGVLEAPPDSAYAWAIVVDGQAAGSLGLFRRENIHRRTAELGYYLAEPYWGRGIMTEAVREACDRAFRETDLLRIFAEPFAHNTGSCRVLEKAGFSLEGILRQNAVKAGQVLDMKLYALLKEPTPAPCE